MKVHFEELAAPQRAGGIEAVTRELVTHLSALGVKVSRSSESEAAGLPDCVHVHGIWSPRLAGKFNAWCQRGVPCVVSPHGMLEPWALSHKWLKKKIAWHVYQKRWLNRAAMLHGTSECEVRQFKTLGLKPPTVLVPWGVELPPQNWKSEVRSQKSVIRTALFVARIQSKKGLPMLVEAWAKVRPAGWKMKIVGPDEAGHRAEVESIIRTTKTETDFEFTGPLQGAALRAAYESASLFILPSYSENFGMAIAEALAAGVPVITTKGTPWEELVSRRCGWWVEINVGSLTAALREAMALTDAERQAMGERGRKLVEENYAWPKIAGDMKMVYEWVLKGGPQPGCVHLDIT